MAGVPSSLPSTSACTAMMPNRATPRATSTPSRRSRPGAAREPPVAVVGGAAGSSGDRGGAATTAVAGTSGSSPWRGAGGAVAPGPVALSDEPTSSRPRRPSRAARRPVPARRWSLRRGPAAAVRRCGRRRVRPVRRWCGRLRSRSGRGRRPWRVRRGSGAGRHEMWEGRWCGRCPSSGARRPGGRCAEPGRRGCGRPFGGRRGGRCRSEWRPSGGGGAGGGPGGRGRGASAVGSPSGRWPLRAAGRAVVGSLVLGGPAGGASGPEGLSGGGRRCPLRARRGGGLVPALVAGSPSTRWPLRGGGRRRGGRRRGWPAARRPGRRGAGTGALRPSAGGRGARRRRWPLRVAGGAVVSPP